MTVFSSGKRKHGPWLLISGDNRPMSDRKSQVETAILKLGLPPVAKLLSSQSRREGIKLIAVHRHQRASLELRPVLHQQQWWNCTQLPTSTEHVPRYSLPCGDGEPPSSWGILEWNELGQVDAEQCPSSPAMGTKKREQDLMSSISYALSTEDRRWKESSR